MSEDARGSRRRVTDMGSTPRIYKYPTRFRTNILASDTQLLNYLDHPRDEGDDDQSSSSHLNHRRDDDDNHDDMVFRTPVVETRSSSRRRSKSPTRVPRRNTIIPPEDNNEDLAAPTRRSSRTRAPSPARIYTNRTQDDQAQDDEFVYQDQGIPPYRDEDNVPAPPPRTPSARSALSHNSSLLFSGVLLKLQTLLYYLISIPSKIFNTLSSLFATSPADGSNMSVRPGQKFLRFVAGVIGVALLAFLLASTGRHLTPTQEADTPLPVGPSGHAPVDTAQLNAMVQSLVDKKMASYFTQHPSLSLVDVKALLNPLHKSEADFRKDISRLEQQLGGLEDKAKEVASQQSKGVTEGRLVEAIASSDKKIASEINTFKQAQKDILDKIQATLANLETRDSQKGKTDDSVHQHISTDIARLDAAFLDLQRLVDERASIPVEQVLASGQPVIMKWVQDLLAETATKERADLRALIADELAKVQHAPTPSVQPAPAPAPAVTLRELLHVEDEVMRAYLTKHTPTPRIPSSREILDSEKELVSQWIRDLSPKPDSAKVVRQERDMIKGWINEVLSNGNYVDADTVRNLVQAAEQDDRLDAMRAWVKTTAQNMITESLTKVRFSGDGGAYEALTMEDVRSEIAHQLEKYSADKNGLVDYALITIGATIITDRTSPSYKTRAASEESLLSFSGLRSFFKRNTDSLPPHTILHPDITPGNCWAFAGGKGHVTVKLQTPIVVTHVSLEHIPSQISAHVESAPYEFRVLGLDSPIDVGTVLGVFQYNIANSTDENGRSMHPSR
eukprot:TRINITY_DN1983_c1_g1_i4.p1 TRINITY_DN1983_c1_g1~~TRINITY_DN1983_c1_g1_i4.p1  ORF type:complete len:802 (-),score=161.62 TRINITY_DN1983_c1_g1_i4:120-2489(-)